MKHVVCKNFSVRSKGTEFLNYFTNTYNSPNCQFPVEMWNHFDNHDERTNNRVEGDNTKMKNFCGASDPKMDKAVGLLQNYETTAHDKYQNAKKENARAPAQKPQDVERETKFRQLRKWYRDGKITFVHYHEEILELHQFEPKKKYVEELEDTDESDPPSISDDSDAEIEENDES